MCSRSMRRQVHMRHRRALGLGSVQARGNLISLLVSWASLDPDLSPLSFSNHGHSNNNLTCQYVFSLSSTTMAISTASFVCCLRSSYHPHLSRKLIRRACRVTLTILSLIVTQSPKPFLLVRFMYPDACVQRRVHLHLHLQK